MNTRTICAAILLALLIPSLVQGITLVENGRSRYKIVTGIAASPSERHGAEELQFFLEKISGARLPIIESSQLSADDNAVIFVGESEPMKRIADTADFGGLGDDGFIIRTEGENLILAGGRKRGTMYAVYTFLENVLGCRWYTSTVSKIPDIPTIKLPALNKKEKPPFEYREPFWGDALDGDWAARNRCNSSAADLDDRRGGKITYRGVHTFYPLIQPDKYYEDHPEWYSVLSNGKRTWEYGQLCLTNPEVMKRTTDRVLSRMARDKDGNIFSVSQNDWHVACECPPCRAVDEREGTHAGTLVYFVNDIADRTSRVYPEKYIGTLAYTYTETPPEFARPGKNVVIRLCNMNDVTGCDAHPLIDCEKNRSFRQNLIGWSKITDKIYIWDYVTDFSNYQMPFPIWYANKKDLQFFRDYGIDGIFEQGATSNKAAAGSQLTAWLEAKLLWNPDLNLDSLMADFMQGYYGPAAGPMLNYHKFLIQETVEKNIHFMLYSPPIIPLYTKENLAIMEAYIKEAEELAAGDYEISRRVEEIRLNWQYVHLNQPLPRTIEGDRYKPVTGMDIYATPARLEAFMKRIREKDTGELWEFRGSKLAYWLMQANINEHKIITLENEKLKLLVIPSLGGRIYQVTHKKSGKNIFRIGTTNDRIFPASGGYTDPFISDHPGRRMGFENFSYILQKYDGGQKIILSAIGCYRGTDDGISLNRVIDLPDGADEIGITTTMELLKNTRRPMQIISHPEFDLGNWQDTQFGIRKADGTFERYEYPEPGDWGYLSGYYRGKEIAAGQWCLINTAEDIGVINTYHPEEVESCNIWVNPATNAAALRLFGFMKQGNAGNSFKLSHTIKIVDNVSTLLQ